MPATWRQCEGCLDWRQDVTERSNYVGRPRVCPHCLSVFETPKKSIAGYKKGQAPQEGGKDVFARFERHLGEDLQARGRARERNACHRADAVPVSAILAR